MLNVGDQLVYPLKSNSFCKALRKKALFKDSGVFFMYSGSEGATDEESKEDISNGRLIYAFINRVSMESTYMAN